MNFVSFIFLFFLSSSWATNTTNNIYDLQIDLSLNQKNVIKKQLTVTKDVKTTINQKTNGDTTYIEVTATEGEIQNNKGILVDLVIGTIAKDGKKTVLSKPQILAKENVPAEITSANNQYEISMSILAKRLK